MKKLIILVGILVVFFSLMLFSQEFTYVGVSKCQTCHKSEKRGKQFTIWEGSKHPQSFTALSSPEAPAKAQESGVENPAESEKCLKCHAPLFEKAAEFKEEGVTCEVCHGPGSAYKKLKIMKSREESVANGLVVYESADAIKFQCLTCHENAHGKSFDFEASWEKIKHPVPKTQ